MTKKTKEAVKTTAVIILVILAVLILWIYPLNQSGKIVSRPDNVEDTLPGPQDYDLDVDTISITTEDNIRLHGLMIETDSALGTVILVHGLKTGLGSQLPKAAALSDLGYNVVAYDQRAYGLSEGRYRSGGYFEAIDLQAVVSRLDLEDRLLHPVIVWGEEHGGTAALRTWPNENRIDYVIVENPIANGRDWQKRIVKYKNLSAPNIMLPLIWWWMKQKSGYEIPVEETDISDQIAFAIEQKSDRFLGLTCGEDDQAANDYIAELIPMGGKWQIFPCHGESLFSGNREEILTLLAEMLTTDQSRDAPAD